MSARFLASTYRLFASASVLMALWAGAANAQVALPHVFSDHAVLQRDAPIHIWGTAASAESVSVKLHGQEMKATADLLGRWSLCLSPEHAGGPFVLTVQGTGSVVTVADILIGDVWIASGQSNMEMPLKGFSASTPVKDGDKEIAAGTLPTVRLLHLPKRASEFPLEDQPSRWTECNPSTAASFSAVAYFFGRELAQKENVPIGLIDSTWGGTPAEAWVSYSALSADSALMPVFQNRARVLALQTAIPAQLAQEAREDAAAKAANLPPPSHPRPPSAGNSGPGLLFNAMIAPLTPLAMKGVIWYQGESNAGPGQSPLYARLFQTLIMDWRAQWGEGDFPVPVRSNL